MTARAGVIIVGVGLLAGSLSIRSDARQAQGNADPLAHGTAVFNKVCASCHGQSGTGGRASALTDNRRPA